MTNQDYHKQRLLINFSYNSLKSILYVEIIQVYKNQKILELEHLEILKFNILQIGGQDEGLQKFSGIIKVCGLEFKSEELITFINSRLIENQNEFQHIVLGKSQKDFIISDNNQERYNQIAFYGNYYEEQQELSLIFKNYQSIIITDLFIVNQMSQLLIDSQSNQFISFIIQNSTFSGQFSAFIINFQYLEINNVDFINITDLQFIFQEQSNQITIKFLNTTFNNCSFSKSDFFPLIQSGKIIFRDVKFIKCEYANRNFITQPYPGNLYLLMYKILISSSIFDTQIMFKNIAQIKVENFIIQECQIYQTMIFSGYSQVSITQLKILDNSVDKSYLIMMYVNQHEKIQYQFRLNETIIQNNTILSLQTHLIAVTEYREFHISNCIYKSNKVIHPKYFVFLILAYKVVINNIIIEKISLQTEFNIMESSILIVQNIIIYGVNDNHNSFIQIDSTQVTLTNISIINLNMRDSQIIIFQEKSLKNVFISEFYIQDVIFNFTNVSLISNIEMFRIIDSYQVNFQNIYLNNITYFILQTEFKKSYLIFCFQSIGLYIKMINITMQNINSYYLEQYSGIIVLYAPIMFAQGSILEIHSSKFMNLSNNSTTQSFIGQFILNQIYITLSNFSNIIGTQLFHIKLKNIGNVYFYGCIFQNITHVNSDNLILFDSFSSNLILQANDIILKFIQCSYECQFVKFNSFQIDNYISLTNIQVFDIELIEFNSIIDQCQVKIENVTALNTAQNIFNIIYLECETIIINNFSFQGISYGNIIVLKQFKILNLLKIYIMSSVFYESSIIQIQLKNKQSYIKINQLQIINSQIILQDIYTQRIISQFNNQYLIDIMNFDAETKIFIDNSKLINNLCSVCYKSLINIFNNNSQSKLVIQSTLFQMNTGSMQSLLQISNFNLFQLRQVVFYNNTNGDQYLIEQNNTKVSTFECYIFNDRVIQNQNDVSKYNIQFSFFFGETHYSNSLRCNYPKIVRQSGMPLYLRLFYNNAQFKVQSYYEQAVLVDQVRVNKFKIYGDEELQNLILLPSNNQYPYQYYDPYQQIHIPYDLNYTIRIIDKQGDIFEDQHDQQFKIQYYLYNLSKKTEIEMLDEQILRFDEQKQGIRLDKLKISFNPYTDNQVCIQLKVNYEQLQNYYLSMELRTFKCQIGEYLLKNVCHQCDETNYQYSLKPHQLICRQVDFDIIEDFKYNKVKLRKGFWRRDISIEQFIFCENNPHACKGGWKAGNQQCETSYIGPMCEECDQHNIMGNGYYHKNYDNQCYQCKYYSSIFTIISTISLIFLLAFYVIRNIQIQNNQFQQYFLQYQQFEILYKLNQNQQNAFIKQFINTSQLYIMICLINGWRTENPLDNFFFFISNPLSFNKFHIQCLFQIHDPRYLLIIYVFSPYLIILLLLACFCFIRRNMRAYSTTSIIYSTTIFIICLLQPNIMYELALFLSQRQIIDEIYVKGSLQYLYNSIPHKWWIKLFIAPQLFYNSLTIPILLFYLLFKIRNDLIQKINRFKFNILFNDYKTKLYFWEIYRIFNREIIIFLIIFTDDHIRKLQGIFLLLSVYCYLLNRFKPYNQNQFNRFEKQKYIVLQIKIILQIMIMSLSNQDSEKQITMALIQTSTGVLLFMAAYQVKLNTQRQSFKIFKYIITISPLKINYIENWIQKQELRQRRIIIYWNLLKTRSRTIGRQGSYTSLPFLEIHKTG